MLLSWLEQLVLSGCVCTNAVNGDCVVVLDQHWEALEQEGTFAFIIITIFIITIRSKTKQNGTRQLQSTDHDACQYVLRSRFCMEARRRIRLWYGCIVLVMSSWREVEWLYNSCWPCSYLLHTQATVCQHSAVHQMCLELVPKSKLQLETAFPFLQ